jgi:hypothetical protein
MTEGIVDATNLNLRDAPGGNVVGVLRKGDRLAILATEGDWIHVSAPLAGGTKLGWVSAAFVAVASGAAPLPPADDDANPVTVSGGKALGPDGTAFAGAHGAGFATLGLTTLDAYLAGATSAAGLAPSVVRAVAAVSANEGRLEAINSYDNAFLSFGLLQWTAGPANGPGELAALLALVQRTDAAVFQEYFGRYGVGVAPPDSATSVSTSGFLTISDSVLRKSADKAQLRSAAWAYRFWRAGHDETVRGCQLALAASRIDGFLRRPVGGRTVGNFMTSEYGVALVLDEHVNRPGHVPATLASAIAALPTNAADPTRWGDSEEGDLIRRYVLARNATNMTDAANRATRIADCVRDGRLSAARGSFIAVVASV